MTLRRVLTVTVAATLRTRSRIVAGSQWRVSWPLQVLSHSRIWLARI